MSGPFRLPLLPAFLVYTIGIYFGYFDFPLPSPGWISILLLLILWIFLLFIKKITVSSWIALLLFFILGIFSIQSYLHPPPSPSSVSHFAGLERLAIEGIVDRPPKRSQDSTQLLIRSQAVFFPNRQIPVSGFVLIFLKERASFIRMGDRLRISCRLYSPRDFRNPGGFSYVRHLAFERIHTIGFLSHEKGLVKLGEGFKNPILLQMERWRDHIRSFLEREANPLTSGMFKALVLGEQGDIPEEVKELFIVTGIAHLLAISGDHLGIVALLSFSFFFWMLKRSEYLLLTLNVKKWAAILTLPCLLLYTFIAGGGMSVIRATIMVIVFFLSILFDRERNLLHTLALAAFLILIFSPPSLFNISFQLSFLAVLSILYLVPRILRYLKPEGTPLLPKTSWRKTTLNYILLSFLVTGVALLGTSPFVALHFNRLSLIGIFTNLLIIPWVGFLIVPLSLIASLFSFSFYPLAALLIQLNDGITFVLLNVVSFFASLPHSSIFVSTPTSLEMILFYLLLFLIVHLPKEKKARYLVAALSFTLILDLAFWSVKDLFQKNLRLTFIDVGQGDSLLVEFPKGKKMLIDGGGLTEDHFDIGKNVIAPFLWKKKIRKIDFVVLTHPDPDHLKGLNFIASQFSIGQFWENGYPIESISYLQLKNTLKEKKVEVRSLNESTPSQCINGVEIAIFNPPSHNPILRKALDRLNLNNSSLVMRLRFKNVAILLTGDIEKEAETRILNQGYPLRSEIIKIPHHGSSSSSSPLFLERVKPTYAILSVGERNFGRLPHPEVLKRYSSLGSRIFRTDQHGAITVTTDGEKTKVKTFVKIENHKQVQ